MVLMIVVVCMPSSVTSVHYHRIIGHRGDPFKMNSRFPYTVYTSKRQGGARCVLKAESESPSSILVLQ
jgi:hypothetical protein